MEFKIGNDFEKGDKVFVNTLVTARKYGRADITKPFKKDTLYYIIAGDRGDNTYAVADISYKEYKSDNEDFYYVYVNKSNIRHVTKEDIVNLAEKIKKQN